MKALPENLETYLTAHSSNEDSILADISRTTHLTQLNAQMISGHWQGRFLEMLCGMLKPKYVLEVGTFVGYATICFARHLAEGGMVHTLDRNDELEEVMRSNFEKGGVSDKIQLHIGDALEIIPTLPVRFDMVFIDGDKEEYQTYYNLVFSKVNVGGYIWVDNVLWHGSVLSKENRSKETEAIAHFNTYVQEDKRVENVMVPVRDGLLLVKKLSE